MHVSCLYIDNEIKSRESNYSGKLPNNIWRGSWYGRTKWSPGTDIVNIAKLEGAYVKYLLAICAVIFVTIVKSNGVNCSCCYFYNAL